MKMRRFLEHNKWVVKWVALFGLFFLDHTVIAQNTEIQQRIFTTGKWVKLEFNQSDVYKITYNDLKSWGFNLAEVDPREIHFYAIQGNELDLVNKSNLANGHAPEIPIYIQGEIGRAHV